jgi:hypothetical protein
LCLTLTDFALLPSALFVSLFGSVLVGIREFGAAIFASVSDGFPAETPNAVTGFGEGERFVTSVCLLLLARS